MIKLDINNDANNDDANTQASFTPFSIASSGSEVNGVVIDLSGDIQSVRRNNPSGTWNNGVYYPRAGERIYRDFVYGISPSGVTITLWGLGVNRDCNITIWAFDDLVVGDNRIANWYANGTHILDTNFVGGTTNWPRYEVVAPQDLYKWAFSGTATTDELGRIILTSSRDPYSPAGENFAFVNALVVEPNILTPFVLPNYAHRPVPFDGAEDAPVDAVLSWGKGGLSETHDVYFGTDEAKVTDANRSNPLGVLVSQDHSTLAYNPPKLLDLYTIYYWRVDEVNSAPDYTIFKGETWSFKTLTYFVMEDFDSYEDDAALQDVWRDNGTSAGVSVETVIAHDGNSMRYEYENNLPPYYSEAYADIVDLGIDDPNWSAIGARALVLYFYGEPTNPLGEQMYVKLTDSDNPSHTATVVYGNMNDTRLKQWNKWSIPLTEFSGVNLANVARITIGFGDGSPGDAGVVYFEDIMLDYEEDSATRVASGNVNANTIYQELEGFGAAVGWHEFEVSGMPEEKREALYDTVFDELGLDIYRVRNSYGYDSDYLERSAQIITAGKARNPSLKVMISSWSPPASLKSNDDVENGGTLKRDSGDPNNNPPYYYIYKKFAQWWADSLDEWSNHGVTADYINMQNETDFETTWATCRFNPTENSSYAGYNLAFEAVYQELHSRMGSNMPKMLAPETAGLNGLNTYINNLIDRNHVYGYAHHLYNGGGYYDYPDGFRNNMIYYRDNYGDKPLMQTEFAKGDYYDDGDVTIFPEAINLAHMINNSMVFENASAYVYWELFWTPPKGLVMYSNTNVNNPVYYALKHYAAFTDPGWHRVGASTSLGDLGNLRISAFKSPDNQQLSIVIINLSYYDYKLTLDVDGFSPDISAIYRTSETERTTYIGPFCDGSWLWLPARSIVTIHSSIVPSDCPDVLNLGYGLASDIDPDCYVNYDDLKIITDHWLDTDCTGPEHCGGADFEPVDGVVNLLDLSRFAEQWLWCNAPEDPGCINNW
jgi:glucuronoarabinoxylan endo-1,4-beta-xylanase